MKKEFRLKKSQDFKKVLDNHHCCGKNEAVSIYYLTNEINHARIGISVSTKVGDAVVRARVRRQVRAQINLTTILTKPFDIVILVRKGYLEKSFQENLKILDNFFSKIPVPVKGENE